MIRFLIGIVVWGSSFLPALSADRSAMTDASGPAPMRFEWHMEGPAEACGNACHTWISAVGIITQDTAPVFEEFAERNNVRGATLVLDSEGGSVVGALAIGRVIRRFDMVTTVGKTIVLPSDDGKMRARLSPDASCESMCAFLLLGGTRRYVPPEARVLVHMIWLGDKRDRAQESSYTAEELGLVQQDIGNIARYTVEMGGGIELLEIALRVPPWRPMYALAPDEIHRTRLTTLESLSGADIALVGAEAPRQVASASANANALARPVSCRSAGEDGGVSGCGQW